MTPPLRSLGVGPPRLRCFRPAWTGTADGCRRSSPQGDAPVTTVVRLGTHPRHVLEPGGSPGHAATDNIGGGVQAEILQ